jgi:alkylated DNA nucleotide flippase Atl1
MLGRVDGEEAVGSDAPRHAARGPAGPSEAVREVVLDLVAAVPPGCATTYGDLAALASDRLARPVTARAVGRVLAAGTDGEPWWRVVGHDGRLPPGLVELARERLLAEGCALRGSRVDLSRARWRG